MSLAADFPKRILDQKSESIQDLKKEWVGSDGMLRKFAGAQVRAGKWEQVYKHQNGKLVAAYRRAK